MPNIVFFSGDEVHQRNKSSNNAIKLYCLLSMIPHFLWAHCCSDVARDNGIISGADEHWGLRFALLATGVALQIGEYLGVHQTR